MLDFQLFIIKFIIKVLASRQAPIKSSNLEVYFGILDLKHKHRSHDAEVKLLNICMYTQKDGDWKQSFSIQIFFLRFRS